MKTFLAYEKLAWVETILSDPRDASDEAALYCKTIKKHSRIPSHTLLHLGCGAGSHDHTFQKHFQVTGVDISRGMLKIARKRNPKIDYHRGDMRTVRLDRQFDAVIIPESIVYMTTPNYLTKAIRTARLHLRPGGVLLIVAHTQEEFRENNFVYSGSKGNCEVTVFENNHIVGSSKSCYEATMVYLIRRNGRLTIHSDRHRIGLFKAAVWSSLLKSEGFSVRKMRMDHLYDRFLMEHGEYRQTVFICVRQ
jgi:ubiquinone/menaquinone biosynthesis C-methylase UbiE